MKQLLDPDAPLMRFLGMIADLFVINVLFVVCALPVVTLGASLTAMYRALFALREQRGQTVQVFFTSLRANFKQATCVWLITAGVFAVIAVDIRLLSRWGMLQSVPVLVLCIAVSAVAAGLSAYLFPFLSRFECGTLQLFSNCLVLSGKSIRTALGVTLVSCLPLLMFLFGTAAFLTLLPFWLCIGFALCGYANSMMLEPLFEPYRPDAPVGAQDE